MANYEPIDEAALLVIENRFKNIAREMGARAIRGIQSPSASLYHDLGTAVLDAKERIIAVGGWLAINDAASDILLNNTLDYIGRDKIFPGDFIISNDPFIIKGGHLPDWSFFLPVFYKDELVSYLTFKTHQYDTGGAFPGCYAPRGYDAHSEGLIIPPVKVFEKGVENKALYTLLLNNVRGKKIVRWDNMLIRGSLLKSAERVIDIYDQYGKEGVEQALERILTRTEKATRSIISKWPAKVFHTASQVDSDGTMNKPVWVKLEMTVKPKQGQLVFDYSGSDMDRDFINSPIGYTESSTRVAVSQILPAEISRNQGLYNCITVKAKEGTVCNPKYPATSGAHGCFVGTNITECSMLAISKIIPKDVSAGWSRHLQPIPFGKMRDRIDPRTGAIQYYRLSPMLSDGGPGAIWGYDGWDGVGFIMGGGTFVRAPVELVEWLTPYRILKVEWITDSSGDGQFRGAIGAHVEFLNEQNSKVFVPGDAGVQTGNSSGEKSEPFGLLGGKPGKKNAMWIKRKGKLIWLKTMDVTSIFPGDLIITESGGGGGVGNPLNRDIEKVKLDVLNRYVSLKKAKEVYGVVLDPVTFEVNGEATNRLRKKLRQARKTRRTTKS